MRAWQQHGRGRREGGEQGECRPGSSMGGAGVRVVSRGHAGLVAAWEGRA